ncbi:hypothetical protein [Erysipelothrix piscisicarius]|uniref:hypothetical protein n=1 Tax=Erysipelothrix piscisicarius TaxID=2485784 RepID=UPI00225DD37E|nr:hypothetical protein [Erysipelothrix piscisicarius]
MNFAVLDQISVSYDGKHNVLQDLDLEIREGNFYLYLDHQGAVNLQSYVPLQDLMQFGREHFM